MWYTIQELYYIYEWIRHLQMETTSPHITELYKRFAEAQQKLLRVHSSEYKSSANGLFDQILSRCPQQIKPDILRQTLVDPYFPLGMLAQTIFSNVDGMRFFINKNRPDLEPVLAAELGKYSEAFLRIRLDIEMLFDPMTITCIPLDGQKHQLPKDQWCTLCGVCCQIGGVPPDPPASLQYPEHWYKYLAGGAVDNQQLCPFLFQYFGEPFFFCGIHHIKPMSCRYFGEEECRKRLSSRGLHQQQENQT